MMSFSLSRSFNSKHKFFWLSAFFVFFIGFFIFHGREAANSGSWRYILSHDDEYGYWTISKGASETPISDGNPFFYEERGVTNSIPYTTAQLVGLLAKLLHLPVMFFFPLWHIGMPFLLWGALFLSMTKIWRYPPGFSAAFSFILLLSTLFLRGQAPFTLSRYSRPGDGLGLLILNLSLIFNLENNKKKYTALAALTGMVLFWLQAYYAILPLIAATGEGFWNFFYKKKKSLAIHFGLIVLAIMLSGAFYFLYIKTHLDQNNWVVNLLAKDHSAGKQHFHTPSLIFYGGLLFLIASVKFYFRQPLTKWDRIVVLVLSVEPLTTHLWLILKSDWQLSSHRYYFLIIELAVLTGWLTEKIPLLQKAPIKKYVQRSIVFLCALLALILCFHPNTCFLLYLTPTSICYKLFDNSITLSGLFPVLCLLVWLFNRFTSIRSGVSRRIFIIPSIALMTFAGYFFLPSQIGEHNRNFPFDGAYRWFEKNTQANEVVLTAMPSRLSLEDYLILYTDLKVYYHPFWSHSLSKDRLAAAYRELFSAALLVGNLNQITLHNAKTLDQKLTRLRLDYILINQPSPFTSRIQEQLGAHIQEVYRDDRSLIWKVTAQKS